MSFSATTTCAELETGRSSVSPCTLASTSTRQNDNPLTAPSAGWCQARSAGRIEVHSGAVFERD